MSAKIHNMAVIHSKAEIGEGVEIGPYAVIGENVRIGGGSKIGPHAVIEGWTEIGSNCDIGPSVVIGTPPQDIGYKGQRAFVKVGDNNVLREFVTVHRASKEDGYTTVGNNNFIMAYSHIAHDCKLGNNIIIANYAGISGHVEIGDRTVISGLVGIHQFVRIGTMCMIGGMSRILRDIVPYVITEGHTATPRGLNAIGLRRNGVDSQTRTEIKKAYKLLFRSDLTTEQALERIRTEVKDTPEIREFVKFVEGSKRGIARPESLIEEETEE
ncbi:MAG: acyl-ACP--UDP-N-acetylglucosamine O-acyltransferase [Deltaproteobacteria bacterium]|nr:acyl-ACP--UDP-N-acetylglucosamine O-acyltransferase [Deltaproteobacteria bacterium]